MHTYPIFRDRLDEYQRVRHSRSPMTAQFGIYNSRDVVIYEKATAAQFVGGTPGVVGAFAGTGLYDIGAVWKAVGEFGDHMVARYRKGLRDPDVVACPTAFIESDDSGLDEQLSVLEYIEHETGLRFGLLTMSGDTRPESIKAAAAFLGVDELRNVKQGKSIHGEILYEQPLDPRDLAQEALRLRIQQLLVALTRGDPAITGRARLMRAGGAVGLADTADPDDGVRIQTLLRAEEVAFPAEEVAESLSRLCQRRHGWNDDNHLENALKVLRSAGTLRKLVKQGNADAERLHRELREKLEWPDSDKDCELLSKLTKRRIPQSGNPSRRGRFRRSVAHDEFRAATSRWDAHSVQWEPLLRKAGVWLGSSRGVWHDIKCPFPHGSADKPGDTGVTYPESGRPAGFQCFHASCDGRNVHDLLGYLEEELGADVVGKYVRPKGAHLSPDVLDAKRVFSHWAGKE